MRVNRRNRTSQQGLMNSVRGASPSEQLRRLARARGVKAAGADVEFNVERVPAAPTLASSDVTDTEVTLTASAFEPITEGRTYVRTEFQVDEAAGDFSAPVVEDSETDYVSAITGLVAATDYIARARHVDNKGNGEWSESEEFSTTA